jgi:SecD/SecF fusion protein
LGRINRKSIYSKKIILLFLDDVVILHQCFYRPISGGRSEISGAFDVTQTKDLANV